MYGNWDRSAWRADGHRTQRPPRIARPMAR